MIRAFGAALLVAVYAPAFLRLVRPETGPAGAATVDAATRAWETGLYGSLTVLGLGLALSILVPSTVVERPVGRISAWLEAVPRVLFCSAVAFGTTVVASVIATVVFGGSPTSVDEMAQLAHASALAAGRLTVPVPGDPAAWIIQNGSLVEGGWAAIYPPLHTLALAAGIVIGVPWLVGPLALGVATGAAAWSFEEIAGSRVGRVGSLLLAVSPYWLFLGAGFLSHATAAAALAVLLAAALAARERGGIWWVVAGAAMGAAVTSRPWVGLATGAALLATVWWPELRAVVSNGRVWAGRAFGVVAGGAPFALLLFAWNRTLYGAPTTLGYTDAFGASHGLGFHRDPWGNVYGPLDAIAYTSADLVQLGPALFESPLPALALVGAGLLLGSSTLRAPLAWVAAAVAANALYWHHGVHFGPRMLFESTPAWVLLFVASAVGVVDAMDGRPRLRAFAVWTVAVAVVGGAALTPRLVGARAAFADASRVLAPALADASPAIVFVHGSWASRIGARLAASGLRRDSIETALRRNDVCDVDRYARGRPEGATDGVLDFEPLPGTPATLESRLLSEGNPVRVRSGSTFDDPVCARAASADRTGVVELEHLLWRGPPLPDEPVWYARDLGPVANARVLAETERTPWVALAGPDGEPTVVDYGSGMELLWRGAAGAGPAVR